LTYRLRLEIPGLPPLQSAGARSHWAKRWRENRDWSKRVAWATTGQRPPRPLDRARIVCTRYSPTEPDYDNLVASFKAAGLDALVRAGVLRDDSPEVVTVAYAWAQAPRGQGHITIEVEG
jgi:Holliday junction resolvase RusA-like endonuclease